MNMTGTGHGGMIWLGRAGAIACAGLLALSPCGCVVVVHDGDSDLSYVDDDGVYHGGRGGRIGVSVDEPGRALAAQTGVDRSNSCVITEVREGWPAEKAGLHKYDIITGIDGQPKASEHDLIRACRGKQPGESVRLAVLRNGQTMEIVVPTAGN